MSFHSILDLHDPIGRPTGAPAHFHDLNLDQIVAAVATGREEYDLTPFFCRPLDDLAGIGYRQEIMQDLERPELFEPIAAFAGQMRETRSHSQAAEQAYYGWHKNGWLLDATAIYCAALPRLEAALAAGAPQSSGLCEFRHWLTDHIGGADFLGLTADTERIKADLAAVRYALVLRGLAVTVRKYQEEIDYSAEIEQVFAKFRQGDVSDYLVKFQEYPGAGHVEAQIVDQLAKLYPEIFTFYQEYCDRNRNFIDPMIVRFANEVQFYIAYLQYIGRLKAAGLPFCYPKLVQQATAVHGTDTFDLALAAKLATDGGNVVLNDFRLEGEERVLVISGPNQGGKTTFARTFGQLHYLASLGCPVPGRDAQLLLCDRILTHFEKEESVESLRGKLQDDLLRIHDVLAQATPRSLIIVNEIFSSTALEDAVFLATEVVKRVMALGCLCVCVTFLDEISALGPSVTSMVSTVDPDDPARRTFKLVRRPADGRAYAMAIAEKYRLTYRSVKERLALAKPC
ncbi:MAG TPA: DNA mismatch repair protein MutS [Stellaceae bacterium]|nr:DNA mismatch repair protein MutS [Stellaceae bacterium]